MAGSVNAPKKRVILPALAAIALLALAVCWLQWENAVSLRGSACTADYAAAESGFQAIVEDPWEEGGVLHISGALIGAGWEAGAQSVHVGLIAETFGAQAADEATLLNTQMVRRADLAQQYGCDDHCGFHAAADLSRLPDTGAQYRVVLLEEADGVKTMMETGMTIAPLAGGLAFIREDGPQREAQDGE